MTELYLYQTVHLCRGRARCVAEHVAVLAAAARELFGIAYAPDLRQLAQRLEAAGAAQRHAADVSCFVRLELLPDGRERLLPAGVTYYDGYALRSLAPEAVSLRYDLPLSEAPTSAREAAMLLARAAAERAGARVAVRCDAEGCFRAAEEAPLFGVCGRTVLLAPGPAGVERTLAVRAVPAAGLELRETAFGRRELPQIEELFWVDHRGVTALSRCDGQPLMSLFAERVAEAMESLFPKK